MAAVSAMALAASAAFAADPPPARPPGAGTSVEVRLTQIEVTVWPDGGDAATCADLTAGDFRLEVNGTPREIVALDRSATAPTPPSGPADAGEARGVDPPTDPLTLVVLFDLSHLGLFTDCCGSTKHLAIEQARRMVRETMHPGDRLLLVTFAGWPVVHGGWLREPKDALAELDRLEVSPVARMAGGGHSHHQEWIRGYQSLLLALGRYPGRKELLYLGDDLDLTDVMERVREIGARAQANRVVMHAFDLVSDCRPRFCKPYPMFDPRCSPWCRFETPVGLGQLSWASGGKLFRSGAVVDAVRAIRDRNCRYVLSFRTTAADARRPPRVSAGLDRKGFSLSAPTTFEDASRGPTEKDSREALFLLPRFGRGIAAEAVLWPLRPTGKKDRWKAVLVARVSALPDDPDLAEVDRVIVRGLVQSRSKVVGEFAREVSARELRELAASGRGKLLTFSVEVRSGPVTIAINARDAGGTVEANFRTTSAVPRPPEDGEAHPWRLADAAARAGDDLTLMPSLDGVLTPGDPKVLVAWGCPGEKGGLDGVAGTLVGSDARRLAAPIAWLAGAANDPARCGWLIAKVPTDLTSGLWHFEPPAALGGGEPIEFRIGEP